jgi:N-glycosylase/DNA lyase
MQIGTEGFKSLSLEELTEILSSLGHRFARQRAERIVKARESFHRTLELLKSGTSPQELRDLLSDACSKYKVEGFGLKEASHFLRNIGYKDVAIIDRHIFRFLKEKGLIPDYKTMTRKIYLQSEKALKEVAQGLGMSVAELDLYVFYLKTGKVLK